MKKVASILLLFLILSPGAGMFLLIKLQQSGARMKMEERLRKGADEAELKHFVFHRNTPKEVRWIHEREFVYGSKMYDVVRQVIQGDSVYIACVYDHRETLLMKHLLKIINPVKSHPATTAQVNTRLAYNWFCNDLSQSPADNTYYLVLLPDIDRFSIISFQTSTVSPPPKV
jgi:hypothetical protein